VTEVAGRVLVTDVAGRVLVSEVVGRAIITIVSFIALSTDSIFSALEGGSAPAKIASMLPITLFDFSFFGRFLVLFN
jgi:hypothetical protein